MQLPGGRNFNKKIASIIRVNHAGEYGARHIYQGQIDYMQKNQSYYDEETLKLVEHMQEQEQEHLSYFDELITKRRVRPSLLMAVWHRAGLKLGEVTAKLGKPQAMACTVAVETIIDKHYKKQIDFLSECKDKGLLKKEDEAILQKIEKFRQDEVEHKDIALENEAKKTPLYPLFSSAIKTASICAIFLAKRF